MGERGSAPCENGQGDHPVEAQLGLLAADGLLEDGVVLGACARGTTTTFSPPAFIPLRGALLSQ